MCRKKHRVMCKALYWSSQKTTQEVTESFESGRKIDLLARSKRSCSPSLIDLHWLPVKGRIEFKVCLLVFKVLKFRQPQYLCDLINLAPNNSSISLRSYEDEHRLEEPRAINNKLFAERSFKYVAPRWYNLLSTSMRSVDTVEVFKEKLKTHIFQKAYNLESLSITADYAV